MTDSSPEVDGLEGETYVELADVRLSGAVVVFGNAAAVARRIRDARARTDLKVVYVRTSGRHLFVREAGGGPREEEQL